MIEQAVDLSRRVGDVVQYGTAAGVVAIVGLVLSIRDRVGKVEATLLRFSVVDERGEDHGITLAKHETRLDTHDTEIGVIMEDRRYHQRRAEDRE